jgi:cyclopropane fatty-acyl-phospholipid synthase-like methyltransferase
MDDGCLAIGLEGSNYSKLHKRAEWATIPEVLFTCDIAGDFEVLRETNKGLVRVHFDVVTAWEVIEHIAESKLSKVMENIKKHLKPGGLWIMSVSPNEEVIDGHKLHLTVRPKNWWLKKFSQAGFEHLEEYVQYFNTQFVRGPKYNAPGSFHLILSLDKNQAPSLPKEGSMKRIMDLWIGSRPQRLIKRVLS